MTNPSHSDLMIRLGHLEGSLEALKEQSVQTRKDVREIRDTIVSARGGWRTLVIAAAVAGAVGALLGKVATLLWVLK